MPAIVWFRQDLRLSDNPALSYAVENHASIIPIYIYDETKPTSLQMGGAQKWWLHHSLESLNTQLKEKYQSKLFLFKGNPLEILKKLVKETKATGLFWNRCYDPHAIDRDKKIKSFFKESLSVESFNGSLLFEPWDVSTKSKKPYQVFTPFYRFCHDNIMPRATMGKPKKIKATVSSLKSDTLESWKLLPTKPNWAKGFEPVWTPGEKGAQKRLKNFLTQGIHSYAEFRDFPQKEAVSRLSPHLHFGEISPHQAWYAAQESDASAKNKKKFQSELGWREFSYYILFHFPHIVRKNFNKKFDNFPWENNKSHLTAWQKGLTGYPLVDAGMRQLWQTGWMHNRIRMVVASFLTKHLLIHWHKGADWFWDTLVDADAANNNASWQWVAGSGADAAPYFRIFNPILQSKKFDATGAYIRTWVPELKNLSDKDIHAPWELPAETLEKLGITLGKTYPHPLVKHEEARAKALHAYKDL